MANLSRFQLIGRLTRDPEQVQTHNNSVMVKFGFATNDRRKNSQTGQMEDIPTWYDCVAYDNGERGRNATMILQHLRKGAQVYLEGKIGMESWADKNTGAQRTRHVFTVNTFQFLDPRDDAPQGNQGGQQNNAQGGYGAPQGQQGYQQPQGAPQGAPRGGYQAPQGAPPHQGAPHQGAPAQGAPRGGYQQPQGGYQAPQGGYQAPQGQPPQQRGYQQPQGGYQQPQGPPQGTSDEIPF